MARIRRPSPTEMDNARDRAQLSLAQLPDEAVKVLANWWNQWYGTAGHRRLGRLLLSRKGSALVKQDDQRANNSNGTGLKLNLKGRIVDDGLKYTLTEAPLDTPAFFELREIGGEVRIVLNTTHPAFQIIKASVNESEDSHSSSSFSAMVLLLQAWADFERQQPDGVREYQAQEVREDWGRSARELIADARVRANDYDRG